jgi:hypothetical protein
MNNERSITTVGLITMVLGLAGMAIWTSNGPVGAMAMAALTGMFAWLQAPPPPPPPGTKTVTNTAQISETPAAK